MSSSHEERETGWLFGGVAVFLATILLIGTNFPAQAHKIKAGTMPNRCDNIMRSDGRMGSVGRQLFNAMTAHGDLYVKDGALSEVCPRFNRMSRNERLKAWVWFWTALARMESSCQPTVKHNTHAKVNGRVVRINPTVGVGLWAMEKSPSMRKGRGKACVGNINSTQVQVSCTVSIMAKHQLKRNRGVLHKTSYWGPIRRYLKSTREAKTFRASMANYASCFQGGTHVLAQDRSQSDGSR